MRQRLLSILLLFPLAFLPATDALGTRDDVLVPAGVEIRLDALHAQGDLVIEGTVASPTDLILRAGGDILLRGTLRAGHGAPGADGGSVHLVAGGVIRILDTGRIEAGAGGHGLPDVREDGVARGADGGQGGHVTLVAPRVALEGAVLPGAGGRGGDAYGAQARGGDGGSTGAFTVNGAPGEADGTVSHPSLPQRLGDVLPARTMGHCPAIQGPALPGQNDPPGPAGDGGNACTHGQDGDNGKRGDDGADDDCRWSNCCSAGDPGGPGLPGHPAEAVAGDGGSNLLDGPAGNGGNAEATGGNGGAGGDGGMGGHSAALGKACDGGNGGDGASGGAATAISGRQGLSIPDCGKNGAPGEARAIGGARGGKGYGGGGGGANWPWTDGDRGVDGRDGATAGLPVAVEPRALPCAPPGAPVLQVAFAGTSRTLRLTILQPSPPAGVSAAASYDVYRSSSSLAIARGPLHKTIEASATGVTIDLDTVPEETTTYYYRVTAISAAGRSPSSNIDSASALFSPPVEDDVFAARDHLGALQESLGRRVDGKADEPTLVARPGESPGTIHLVITPAPGDPQGSPTYTVYRWRDEGGEWDATSVADLGPQLAFTPYLDEGLVPGAIYSYAVVADRGGERAVSDEVASPAGAARKTALGRNYCEPVAEWSTHVYGPPAAGALLGAPEDGNLLGDCDGLSPPGGDFDGHHEYAAGGAWLSVHAGDGHPSADPAVGAGSLYCHGEDAHHSEYGPITVYDSLLGSGASFTVAADTMDLIGGGKGCGDLQADVSVDCLGTCAPTFPPGLDGTYRVLVAGSAGQVVG